MTDKFAAKMVYNIATNNKLNFTLEEIEALRMAVTALKLDEQIRWERDIAIQQLADLGYSLGEKPKANSSENPNNSDCISRQETIDAIVTTVSKIGLHDNSEVARYGATFRQHEIIDIIEGMPSAHSEPSTEIQEILNYLDTTLHPIVSPDNWNVYSELYDMVSSLPSAQPEVIRCKDCKHWRQQTNYQGVPLSFGFCESEDMWCSLYGETVEVSHIDTDDDFYCGYAERRTDA